MNFKDFFAPAVMAFCSIWLIQYLFIPKSESGNGSQEFHVGQMVKVPATDMLLKPLNTTLNIAKAQGAHSLIKTNVKTPYGIFTFSTQGAVLENFELHRTMYGKEALLSIISKQPHTQPFLVALEQETPYYYDFIGQESEHGTTTVSYRAVTSRATITKLYRIYDDRYQVDLTLAIEPHDAQGIQPRIIFSGPLLHDARVSDEEKALIYTDQKRLDKKTLSDLANNFWVTPALVGIENRYFAIATIQDKEHFIQRAYFKPVDSNLLAFMEGPIIKEPTSWTLSFFIGPKEADALATVDNRLLDILDYGFFSWLGRLMMALLNWLYKYLHNYGWAIVLLTIAMRLVMMPLSFKSQTTMRKTSDIQKKLHHIEQYYKNDQETLMRKRQELSMQAAPSLLIGCAVFLLQIPLFIGLSNVLRSSIELYQAPFILWIKDLSAHDPYYILPILAAAGLITHTSSSGSFDPRQRISMLMMTFVFGAVTANFSAGLALFTVTSIWMGIFENRLYTIMKKKA